MVKVSSLFIFDFELKLESDSKSYVDDYDQEQWTENTKQQVRDNEEGTGQLASWVLVVGLKVIDESVERRKEEAEPWTILICSNTSKAYKINVSETMGNSMKRNLMKLLYIRVMLEN